MLADAFQHNFQRRSNGGSTCQLTDIAVGTAVYFNLIMDRIVLATCHQSEHVRALISFYLLA